MKQKLKRLTSLAVDGRSLGWRRVWHGAEESAREQGGPEDSSPRDWTIIGERPLTGDTGLRAEVETWQLDGEREEGGAGDWQGLGDGLRGGDGPLCGIREGALGDREPPEDAEAEASRRLRANRALLALAELFWVGSLGGGGADWLGSGSIGWHPGWGLSPSLWELSAPLDLLSSSRLPSLSVPLSSSSSPPFPTSKYWRSLCISGWIEGSSQTPKERKDSLFNTFSQLHNFFNFLSIL